MKVATLGPAGTFSHEMALSLFGEDSILLLPTIRAIFQQTEKGICEGLVPIENSEAGSVGATLDGLQDHEVAIVGEMYMKIRHHFAASGPAERIALLYVHPQTHEQCSEFVDALELEVVHTSSNAASAREAARHPDAAAITSSTAARLYGIPVLKMDVQNRMENITRFIEISQHRKKAPDPEKCSILVDPAEDRAGLLYDLLGVFAEKEINLTRIESRPARRGMGSYVFFIDFAAGSHGRSAVRALSAMARVKEFGCYRRLEVPE